jgi:hypothetical protein
VLHKRARNFNSLANETYAKEVFDKIFWHLLAAEADSDTGKCDLSQKLDTFILAKTAKDTFNVSYGDNNNIDKLSKYLDVPEMKRLISLTETTSDYADYVQNLKYHIYLKTDTKGKQSILVKYILDGSEQELLPEEDLKTFLNKHNSNEDFKTWFIGKCIQKDAEKRKELATNCI